MSFQRCGVGLAPHYAADLNFFFDFYLFYSLFFTSTNLQYTQYRIALTVIVSYSSEIYRTNHRVGRVLGFFSSRPNWDSPTPSPTGEGVPPFLVGGGGVIHTRLREWGWGEVPIPTRNTDTVVLYMYFVNKHCF